MSRQERGFFKVQMVRLPLYHRVFCLLLDHWLTLLLSWVGAMGFLGLFIREPGTIRLAIAPVVVAIVLSALVVAAGLLASLIGRFFR